MPVVKVGYLLPLLLLAQLPPEGTPVTRGARLVVKAYSHVVPTTHPNPLRQADLACEGDQVITTRWSAQPEAVST